MTKRQVLQQFRSAIKEASKDRFDIVSSYELVFEDFNSKYPQYIKTFESAFIRDDRALRKKLFHKNN